MTEHDETLLPLTGWRVCLSGGGQGEIAGAIRTRLTMAGASIVRDAQNPYSRTYDPQGTHVDTPCDPCDVAICTTGSMLIRHAHAVTEAELERLHTGNYLLPRYFTERIVACMRHHKIKGLIIHLGSNAPWYGNVGAEDYAAYKSALRKYLELRGRDVRKDGFRISLLGFGGVATKFWDKATAGADPELARTIVPGDRQPLTADEAAAVVMATILLPPNVCLRDALIVSRDYQ